MALYLFPEDARCILAGLAQQAARRIDGDYGRGYQDALSDVALSFGLVAGRRPGGYQDVSKEVVFLDGRSDGA